MAAYDKKTIEAESQDIQAFCRAVSIGSEGDYIEKGALISEAEGGLEANHDQAPLLVLPQERPYYRSYVSKKLDPPAWVEEPVEEPSSPLFKEGETVLLLRAEGTPARPYTIETCHGDGRYSLYHIKGTVSESELKRPDYQKR